VAGSAKPTADQRHVAYAHQVVEKVVAETLQHGGGLVTGAGKEPQPMGVATGSKSVVFDWTALETAARILEAGKAKWAPGLGPPVAVVTSEKAQSEVPTTRQELWTRMIKSGHVQVEFIQPGARSGALIRTRQFELGDVLLTLGGGAGVEHLAQMFLARRRPVVPLDLPLGASREDGTGGSELLAKQALAEPNRFFALRPELRSLAGSYLAATRTHNGAADHVDVSDGIISILLALDLPCVFYVRLLNPDRPEFPRVERFFRQVVDPLVKSFGFRRIEMGTDAAEHAFMNLGIFECLHFAPAAVVDITGLRPNCFIEMGYAFGRGVKTIVTAEEGTLLPFDQSAVPCHFWNSSSLPKTERALLRKFWEKNINRPPLVREER
jgi:hypothetical protein